LGGDGVGLSASDDALNLVAIENSINCKSSHQQVYERGVASITNSVDLWTNYCSFKVETSHDPDVIRE
jgi:pre-mRNA-processing factor 39